MLDKRSDCEIVITWFLYKESLFLGCNFQLKLYN